MSQENLYSSIYGLHVLLITLSILDFVLE